MKPPFLYTFRFCCDPGFREEEELESLSQFVQCAQIDDVAVFANVEELNTGHMTFEEQDRYLALMHRVQQRLSPFNVTMSVNQWHSVMHADLGKRFREEDGFRPMVDIDGRESDLCVCPLSEAWQAYIGELYARYAALSPFLLWVEDDFRLHNHAPLHWGGCFCEEHMRLYSERAGKTLSREEFVRGILAPGEVHPYRKIWLDVGFETMRKAAEAIERAVHRENPAARIGLMSSDPHIHAAEGRRWGGLLKALAGDTCPADRIHLPGYQETAPGLYLNTFNQVSMLTRAFLPAETEVYPELENYPFSRFAKSKRFTRFQLLCLFPLAADGVMLDLFDLNGNGIVWQEGYQEMLREVKPYLSAIARFRAPFARGADGVRVLVCETSAYTLHTSRGAEMEELYPQETLFAGLLPAMGIPYRYETSPDCEGQIVAVSGQVLRNWDEETIRGLFMKNRVLLSGDAACVLLERGLGELAGLEAAEWMVQDEGAYTYEQVVNGRVYGGLREARASAVISCSDALRVTFAPGANAALYTAFFDSFRRRTAPGEALVKGRVFLYPFGRFPSPIEIPPMLLNTVRQEILQEALLKMGADFPMVQGAPYAAPYTWQDGKNRGVYLVNASTEDIETLSLRNVWAKRVVAFDSRTKTVQAFLTQPDKDGVRLALSLPSMEAVMLWWEQDEKE